MLKECLEVFQKVLEDKKTIILDTYMPAEGTYVILKPTADSFEVKEIMEIKYNKKTRKNGQERNVLYPCIRFYDYHCKLIDMDKPIDAKKVIHSNNFLSFFIKKENITNGKLTADIIERYYNVLEDPNLKYKKPKAKKIYEKAEEELGLVDKIMLEKVRKWIKEKIFSLNELDIVTEGKDYLKLFFEYDNKEETREMMEIEGKRYLLPNIYNNNDFNLNILGETYGVPNNNMGLNSKKIYLENKSRKVTVPYLLNNEEVLLQKKFFDFLMNLASRGMVNIYFDYDKKHIDFYEREKMPSEGFNGLFLRINKGKEVEIHDFESISDFRYKLKNKFYFKNILQLNLEQSQVSHQRYGACNDIKTMQDIINEVFFSKYLIFNYFTDAKDMKINDSNLKGNLLMARESIFNWIYKGVVNGIPNLIDKISCSLVINAIENNYFILACHRFNLRWSLNYYFKKGMDMGAAMENIVEILRKKINAKEDFGCDSEEEYYFAIGQLTNYLLSLSKQKEPAQSSINPILNSKSEEILKANICRLYKKYNYRIQKPSMRFDNIYRMIVQYRSSEKANQDFIIAGYLSNSLIYEKAEGEKHE